MTFDRQVLERSGALDKLVEEVQEIAGTNYSDRMHVEPSHNVSDDVLRAYVEDTQYDEETTEHLYEDLQRTDFGSEEIKEVFIEHTDVDLRELNPIDRRQFMKLSGAAAASFTAASYIEDSDDNQDMLEDANQDHFKAPARSYHEAGVESMLNGEELDFHLFNIYFGEEDNPDYEEERISDELESNLEELEEVEVDINFHNVNVTVESLDRVMPGTEYTAERTLERFEQEISDVGAGGIHPSYLGRHIQTLVNYQEEGIEPQDIKIGIADFEESNTIGSSRTNAFTGEKDWAFSQRLPEDELIGTLTHEAGHKLGLPHTKYPDLKRLGFFPDTMSYSDGDLNIPARIHDIFDNSSFGAQSHYNWDKVRETHRS